jgi:hypothetical protein
MEKGKETDLERGKETDLEKNVQSTLKQYEITPARVNNENVIDELIQELLKWKTLDRPLIKTVDITLHVHVVNRDWIAEKKECYHIKNDVGTRYAHEEIYDYNTTKLVFETHKTLSTPNPYRK